MYFFTKSGSFNFKNVEFLAIADDERFDFRELQEVTLEGHESNERSMAFMGIVPYASVKKLAEAKSVVVRFAGFVFPLPDDSRAVLHEFLSQTHP